MHRQLANVVPMPEHARAIEHLLHVYAERIDAGDLAGVAALFAHGRIRSGEAVFEGAERVEQLYTTTTRRYPDGTPRTRHVTTNVIVEVGDDDTASARSSYTVFQQTDELPLQAIIVGRYHDTFHRVAGSWRFDTREILVDLVGDLSHHLLIDL